MSPKTLVAFLAGLVVASGITFFVMRKPQPAAQPVAVQHTSAAQPAPAAPAAAAAAPAATTADTMASDVPPAEEETAPATPRHVKAPARTTRHERHPPQMIAQVQQPPAAAPNPAPVQQTAPAPAQEQQPATETRNVVPPAPAPPPPEAPAPNTVTVAAGTTVRVRIGETLSTERNKDGDSFVATLDQPLVVDGFVIAERGARARGRVVEALRAGRVKGLSKLAVELTEVSTSDGQRVRIDTSPYENQARTTHKGDAAKIGGGAALGAIIGAIAGGGVGAAIGAGVGGAAGTGGVMMTRGKPVEIPVETRVSFRLKSPVTITEQLH